MSKIIVHCSASNFGNAVLIDKWHREKGWKEIGYQNVITNGFPSGDHWKEKKYVKILDGQIEIGRMLDADDDLEAHEAGAHAYGYNRGTVGICLIGDKVFTKEQLIKLIKLIKFYQFKFGIPTENVVGHSELPGVSKSCPNIDMNLVRDLVRNKTQGMRLLGSFKNFMKLKEVRYESSH